MGFHKQSSQISGAVALATAALTLSAGSKISDALASKAPSNVPNPIAIQDDGDGEKSEGSAKPAPVIG